MADITIIYNDNILEGTLKLLEATNLKDLVNANMKVSIKPNLVNATPASKGATTHSEVVEGIIMYLHSLNVSDIEIIESSWIGGNTKEAYRVCGYKQLCEKYNIPFYDLKDDEIQVVDTGKHKIEVCKKAINTDFLINVPVLKAHSQTSLTCNLKNLKGCISDEDKRRFHAIGLFEPIAYLNKAIPTDFCVVDGICGDLTFELGGDPVTRNMLIAGSDPLLVDSYCAQLIGYDPYELEYLCISHDIGIGKMYSEGTSVLELGGNQKPVHVKADSSIAKRLATHINEDKACSACYAALIYGLYNGTEPDEKIDIGQGFIGKSGNIGCGNCCSGYHKFVPGCPPRAVKVKEFLDSL